jgi:hypothetical protein
VRGTAFAKRDFTGEAPGLAIREDAEGRARSRRDAMQYEELVPMSREDAAEAFARNDDTYSICYSLLCIALHDPDWRWALPQVMRFIMHPNPEVRGVAVSCIGYLARIHRSLDVTAVLPMLRTLQSDPYVKMRVRDTLSDIAQFL